MRSKRFALSLLFVLVVPFASQSAFAKKAEVPKMQPGASAIGIELDLRQLLNAPAGVPAAVFFVRTDAEGGLTQDQLRPADLVIGERAYLLNIVPGEYAAVAAFNYENMPKFVLALAKQPPYVTYFAKELIEATRVKVGAGEFGYAGSHRVRQIQRKAPDEVQKFYRERIDAARGFNMLGHSQESKRDDAARDAFLAKAREDLAEGGWGELLSPKPAQTTTSMSPAAVTNMLVDRAEAGQPPDPRDVESTAKSMQTWLEAHPEDVDALIASARISWLAVMSAPVIWQGSQKPPDPALEYAPAHAFLDRALALQPQNAEALYWKARLYGAVIPDFSGKRLDYRAIDLEQSIAFARKAVASAPAEPRYRVALAQYLAGHQEPKEAIQVLEAMENGRGHALYGVLHDFETFPVIEQAAYDRASAQNVARLQAEKGNLRDYRYERVRAYVVPAPITDVEAFYKARWPQFKLGKPEVTDERGIRIAIYGLAFRRDGETWQQQQKFADPPMGMMAVVLSEIRNAPPETRTQFAIPVGDVYCVLLLANFR